MQVENPEVPIYVRARDMRKMNRLKNLGVVATYAVFQEGAQPASFFGPHCGIPDLDYILFAFTFRYPETLESSLALAEEVMRGYGIPDQDVRSIAKSVSAVSGFLGYGLLT
mmetsp:Transcript_34258/g.134278  ORF Transcript_34258/g.134278 Transcript_34258/m.134278 type:complete len:111 (+) Transcript_34258:330-662(+)